MSFNGDRRYQFTRAKGHLDELQKAEKYPIRWSLQTGFTVHIHNYKKSHNQYVYEIMIYVCDMKYKYINASPFTENSVHVTFHENMLPFQWFGIDNFQ